MLGGLINKSCLPQAHTVKRVMSIPVINISRKTQTQCLPYAFPASEIASRHIYSETVVACFHPSTLLSSVLVDLADQSWRVSAGRRDKRLWKQVSKVTAGFEGENGIKKPRSINPYFWFNWFVAFLPTYPDESNKVNSARTRKSSQTWVGEKSIDWLVYWLKGQQFRLKRYS